MIYNGAPCICGTEKHACIGDTDGHVRGLQWVVMAPSERDRRSESGPRVTYRDSAGHRFRAALSAAQRFVAAHPGATIEED